MCFPTYPTGFSSALLPHSFSILLYRWDYSFQDNSVTGIRPEVSETFWNIIELDQANRTRVVATLPNNPKISKNSDEIETHGDRSTLYIPYLGWLFSSKSADKSQLLKPGTIGATAPAATAGAFGWSEALPVPSTPPWPPRLRTFLGDGSCQGSFTPKNGEFDPWKMGILLIKIYQDRNSTHQTGGFYLSNYHFPIEHGESRVYGNKPEHSRLWFMVRVAGYFQRIMWYLRYLIL